MRRWWRRNRHWVARLGVALAIVMVAALSATVMRAVLSVAGFAFSVGSMAVLMMIQVVFYFGFVMYYLGGVKSIKIMPGSAAEVTFDDYWGQPELLAVARQWVHLLSQPERLRKMGGSRSPAFSWRDLLAPARHTWPRRWPARPWCPSSGSMVLASSRCGWGSGPSK